MPSERILIEGWPALLSTEMAACYLSLDDEAFNSLVVRFGIMTVETAPGEPRWKRIDLDKLVSRLPAQTPEFSPPRRTIVELDENAVAQIVAAILSKLADPASEPRAVVTLQKARQLLGLSKSSIYRMMADGRLQAHRIGRRTLIRRHSIDALLAGSPT